jgi:predicted transporter
LLRLEVALARALLEVAFLRGVAFFFEAAFFLRVLFFAPVFFFRAPAFFLGAAFFFLALFFLRTAMIDPLTALIRPMNSDERAETNAPGFALPRFRSPSQAFRAAQR